METEAQSLGGRWCLGLGEVLCSRVSCPECSVSSRPSAGLHGTWCGPVAQAQLGPRPRYWLQGWRSPRGCHGHLPALQWGDMASSPGWASGHRARATVFSWPSITTAQGPGAPGSRLQSAHVGVGMADATSSRGGHPCIVAKLGSYALRFCVVDVWVKETVSLWLLPWTCVFLG